VRILIVIVLLLLIVSFFLLSFDPIVIVIKYINNNSNSFININDFNLNNNGANIKELNNNNRNPIIPLFNIRGTPLNTINKKDKGPIFSLILKKTKRGTKILLIKQRI
jgi:hypothetical protein